MSANLDFSQLVQDYQDIHLLLDAQWPIDSDNERLAARSLKLTEEIGELCTEVLNEMGLQRQEKLDAYDRQHLEDEWADAFGSLLLLGIELGFTEETIAKAMDRKIQLTMERLQQPEEA